jgi:hypothetical protein
LGLSNLVEQGRCGLVIAAAILGKVHLAACLRNDIVKGGVRGSAGVAVAAVLFVAVAFALDQRAMAQASDGLTLHDPVTLLDRQLENGDASLDFRPRSGYLGSLLERLNLNVDSQVLVFSKTSFQQALISPRAPRALFFNDKVAVGSVQGGEVFEVMAFDARQGAVFYTLATRQSDTPRFQRRGAECVFCHLPGNHGAPGLVVASVIPNSEGVPFFGGSFFGTTDHRTPFEQRWGGWYVTGTHGWQTHMGNAVAPDPDRPVDLDLSANRNITTLAGRFDSTNYLTSTSDIVALMTLEHQAGMTNRIVGLSRQWERAHQSWVSDSVARTLDLAIDDLVAYMLFVDEVPLRERVTGVSTFTKTFPERGPRDARGRSLRDFDLRTRLFRYPLSYMIYSEVFDHMPASALERVYRRLYDVLTGTDARDKFGGLSPDDRRATLEILLDTKATLPAYWK